MKRIAHLTTVHRPGDPRIRREIRALQNAGFGVSLVAQGRGDHVLDGAEVLTVGRSTGRYSRARLFPAVMRRALELEADAYHFHDPELIPVAHRLKSKTGARIVYDVHEDYRWHGPVEGRAIRLMERWCAGWVDHIVTAADGLAAMAREWGANATAVPNYFDPPEGLRPRAKRLTGRLTAIYTGVIAKVRGLETLVELASMIAETDAPLGFGFTGVCYVDDERRAFAQTIGTLSTQSRVEIEGWDQYVPHERIIERCKTGDVGLALWRDHPNHSAVPTKFYEYVFHGLPIICTPIGPWVDFVERHGCGIVVPFGDARAVFDALQRYLREEDLYERHSLAAQEASHHYMWPESAARLVRVYEELLQGVVPNG